MTWVLGYFSVGLVLLGIVLKVLKPKDAAEYAPWLIPGCVAFWPAFLLVGVGLKIGEFLNWANDI